MHWHIPTQHEDATHGGPLFVNACLATGNSRTETGKKATCKQCKALFAHPPTASIAAAKLRWDIIAIQEENKFSAQVQCDCCPNDVDVSDFINDPAAHDQIVRLMHLLEHCAYEHIGGAEVHLIRVQNYASAYENNYAVGKPALSMHEEAWRERHGLVRVSG
jgi:hypothetical protein